MKRFVILSALISLLSVSAASARSPQIFSPPVMGWSSWNTYRVNISDSLIRRQADAMVSLGLRDAGYSYINIDDGFFGGRDKEGVMHTSSQRFPDGMEALVGHIHSLGLKAGIYSDAGGNTCGSMYDNDKNGIGAGLYGHEVQDVNLYFRKWKFDYIKIDYCGAGYELNLDERRRYTEIRSAIDKAGCGNVSINICRWAFPGTWAKDIASSWRISSDIGPKWSSVERIIEKNMYLSAYAGEGHYNDMDMLEIGRGLKHNEEEAHFGMWCIMSSPLLIGCDLTKLSESSLKLLKNKELISLDQDKLGLQAYIVQHNKNGYVFVKDIEQRRGDVRAVALYNPSDTICDFSVPLALLEMGGLVKVRDMVRQKDLPSVADELKQQLPARSVLILRMQCQKRLEPSLYEAEWSYLPCFDDLGKTKKPVVCLPCKNASGGAVVSNLGGRKENCAVWNDVYSEEGGEYDMDIRYIPKEGRKLNVSVNNEDTLLENLPDNGAFSSVTVHVRLRRGYNNVVMCSPYCWAPDIDCFTLTKTNKQINK